MLRPNWQLIDKDSVNEIKDTAVQIALREYRGGGKEGGREGREEGGKRGRREGRREGREEGVGTCNYGVPEPGPCSETH